MRALFDVDKRIAAALADPLVMDPETGELLDEGPLKMLEVEKERLVLHFGRAAANARDEGEAVAIVAERLAKRAAACINRADAIKQHIAEACAKGEKFRDDCVRVSIQESVSVDVFNEDEVPWEYKVQPPLPLARADKKAIRKHLDEGGRVEGARLACRRFTKIS